MPKKPQYTKEEIINIAFEKARKTGLSSVTARDIAKELGTTVSPIFTLFKNMKELKDGVIKKAYDLLQEYLSIADEYYPTFKKRGMQLIKFSKEEKELFKMLYLNEEGSQTIDDYLKNKRNYDDINAITSEFNLNLNSAMHLYDQLYIYSLSICVLQALNVIELSEEEVSLKLGNAFYEVLYTPSYDSFINIIPVKFDSKEYINIQKLKANGGK